MNDFMDYFVQWGHIYIIHFGAWITFMFAISMYGRGIPKLKELPNMFKTAIILSLILSIFSSHSHHNFLNEMAGK